jgi:uncharacterized protein (TIGR03435 family)
MILFECRAGWHPARRLATGAKRLASKVAALAVITFCSVFAQSVRERPAFEVASIKPYTAGSPIPTAASSGLKVSPDGVSWRYTRLLFCLAWAYDIHGDVFGPDWIKDRYDIIAKASGPVPEAELKLMAQTLLEDRFKLKVHRELRELPVVVLIAAKGGAKDLQRAEAGDPPKYETAAGKLVFEGSMSSFAAVLGNSPPYGVRERVVDQTGITGLFKLALNVGDFDVNDPVFGGNYEEMRSAAFSSLSAALEKQLGLKLEHRKVPLESLIVDGGNKVPTGN